MKSKQRGARKVSAAKLRERQLEKNWVAKKLRFVWKNFRE